MYKHFFKRVLDFTIVFIAMLFIWWILAIVAIWLHFANKGAGAFYHSKRVGRGEKEVCLIALGYGVTQGVEHIERAG